MCLTADPGVASAIPARSHTLVEIDREIISTAILLPSTDTVVIPLRQFGSRHPLRCYSKITIK